MKNPDFELVVPAYNESKNLPLLIQRAVTAAQNAQLTNHQFQLIVVQNGSTDNSQDVLQELQNSPYGAWFRIVKIDKNQGYGFGLWSGLNSTTARYVGWSHADLQCDPSDACKAYKMLISENTPHVLIKGVRQGRNWKDKMVSRFFEVLAFLILGLRVYEMNAQPKIFHRSLLEHLKSPPKTFAFDLYVLYWAKRTGFKVKTVPVVFPPRIHGISNWAGHFLSRYKTIFGIVRYMVKLAQQEGRL